MLSKEKPHGGPPAYRIVLYRLPAHQPDFKTEARNSRMYVASATIAIGVLVLGGRAGLCNSFLPDF